MILCTRDRECVTKKKNDERDPGSPEDYYSCHVPMNSTLPFPNGHFYCSYSITLFPPYIKVREDVGGRQLDSLFKAETARI